jgi:cytosine/adenosine deaminase-related metal-dependent hydrolase
VVSQKLFLFERGQFLHEEALMTARQAFRIASRDGATVLGCEDISSLEPGKCADFFAVNLN